jgi:toxin HigB-1
LAKKYIVDLSKKAQDSLIKVPGYIKDKLLVWVDDVEREGLEKVRKIPGFHDEPLKGDRVGQRSIRLSKAYRAIYIEEPNKEITIILVKEVNKHAY